MSDTAAAIVRMDAFEPGSYSEVRIMAADFAKSGLCRFRTMEQVALVMLTAKDLSIPKSTALRQMWISPDGTPRMDADLIVGLCLRDPSCEYFYCKETTRDHATYVTKRRNNPKETEHTFTIEDARAAGLVKEDKKDSSWVKWLRAMLRHRASAELARMVYPDKVGGLYSMEEFDTPETTGRPAPAAAVRPIVAAPLTAAGQNQPMPDPGPNVAPPWVDAEEVALPTTTLELGWPERIAAAATVEEVRMMGRILPKDMIPALTERYNAIKAAEAKP